MSRILGHDKIVLEYMRRKSVHVKNRFEVQHGDRKQEFWQVVDCGVIYCFCAVATKMILFLDNCK